MTKRLSYSDHQRIIELFEQGLTKRYVAKIMKVTPGCIKYHLKIHSLRNEIKTEEVKHE